MAQRRGMRLAATVLVGLVAGMASLDGIGYAGSPGGLTTRTLRDSGTGCATCHGSAQDGSMSVVITGPTALNANEMGTYTITATRSGVANGSRVGMAVAASSATIAPFSGEPMSSVGTNEVIHSSGVGTLKTTTSGSASYKVNFTMPNVAGGTTRTLYAVSAIPASGWRHATNFTITARPSAPSTVSASNITTSSVDLSWSGGGPQYRVVYKPGSTPPASETDGTTINAGSATSTTVSGLTASTQYAFKVYSMVGSVFSSTGPSTTATTAAQVAATRYVNASTGLNSGGCTSAGSPCRTITYAMGQAANGDTVSVAPGTYNLTLGEAFPITMKPGIQLLSSGTAENTTIDGAGDTVRQGLLGLANNNSAPAVIRGFRFKNGVYLSPNLSVANGGALNLTYSTAKITVDRNIFDVNESRGYAGYDPNMTGGIAYGGAVYVYAATTDITNNIFYGSKARGGNGYTHLGTPRTGNENGGNGYGGAIYFLASGKIVNNTFYDNAAIGGSGGSTSTGSGNGGGAEGGAIYMEASGPGPNIDNNIFYGNYVASGTGGTPVASSAGAIKAIGATSVANNLFFGNTGSGDTAGTNSVFADPLFHGAPANMRIGYTSPAYAAGTSATAPGVDFDNRSRPNPPSIGAFEASGYDAVVMDFNGDTKSDILWRNNVVGYVFRMSMNGLAKSSEALVYSEPNTAWRIVADGDFNGDGVSDLLWRNTTTGQVYMMFFSSSGFVSGGALFYTEANQAWKIVQTPDINGDGKADIVWWNSSTGQVYVMIMSGGGIVAADLIYQEANTNWQIAAVGDFSGSGKQNQLLWRNSSTAQIYLMTVTYTGSGFTQTGQMIYQAQVAYKIVGIGDFNGDGRSDILWRHDSTGDIYLQLMAGGASTAEGVIYTEGNLAWKIVGVGDYNGDGKADLLWRNDSTGGVYMMLNGFTSGLSGITSGLQGFVHTEPSATWRIMGLYEYANQ